MGETEPEEHGIDGGAYDNLGRLSFGHPCPYLRCLCGFSTPSGAAESWEEAGFLLDDHLAQVGSTGPDAAVPPEGGT